MPISLLMALTTGAQAEPNQGSLHEVGREERERDRHIDLSNAPFVAGSNLLDTGQGASNNLIKPDATSLARVSTRMGRES
jgi:hypothetical protein